MLSMVATLAGDWRTLWRECGWESGSYLPWISPEVEFARSWKRARIVMEGEIERFVDLGSAKCRECGINV